MSTISIFVKLVVATLKGDDAEVLGLKIQKRATAALKAPLAAKEAKTLELEDIVDSAKEALTSARMNDGKVIENNVSYIQALMKANLVLEEAEEALTAHKQDIEFLTGELVVVSA